jgi:hypothetical protein
MHTETLRSVAAVSAIADHLDTLSSRLRHPVQGPAAARQFFWIAEALSPVLPRLGKHVVRGRRMKLKAIKLEHEAGRSVQSMTGPRGSLP